MSSKIVPQPPRSHDSGRDNPQMKKPQAKPLFPAIVAIKTSQGHLPGIGPCQRAFFKKPTQPTPVQQTNAQGSKLTLPPLLVAAKGGSPDAKGS